MKISININYDSYISARAALVGAIRSTLNRTRLSAIPRGSVERARAMAHAKALGTALIDLRSAYGIRSIAR